MICIVNQCHNVPNGIGDELHSATAAPIFSPAFMGERESLENPNVSNDGCAKHVCSTSTTKCKACIELVATSEVVQRITQRIKHTHSTVEDRTKIQVINKKTIIAYDVVGVFISLALHK